MYIKNINDFIKESNEYNEKIIFSKFIHLFKGDYFKMISWLNMYCQKKKVIYIGSDGEYIDSNFIVENYSKAHIINNVNFRVKVTMVDGRHGEATGLVYKEKIFLPDIKVKKIIKPEIDPFNEEDWGYEEI